MLLRKQLEYEKIIRLSFDARQKTDYSEVGQLLAIADDFYEDAIGLYQAMSGESWE